MALFGDAAVFAFFLSANFQSNREPLLKSIYSFLLQIQNVDLAHTRVHIQSKLTLWLMKEVDNIEQYTSTKYALV